MTKTIKRLLPAALAVLLAGCAMQPVDSTTARYRVALVAKNNRDSEFWDAVFTGAEAAATEYNLQLTITAPDDEEDYAAQNQLIADAVEDAGGLDMGAADGVGGLVHRRFEAEGMGDEIDVVVDGFRNPDNGDVLAAPGDFLLDGRRSLHRPGPHK